MTYAQKLKDPRWQKRRLHILEQRGWKCERCRDDRTTLHVHHKKYRGQPWEALDHDLEVLCEPCHSGKHGKANSTKRFSVYCAGKIGISDWRHRLFDLQFGEGYESLWASQDGLIQVSYAGPYFAESDHGSAHGDGQHGQLVSEWLELDGGHVYAGDFSALSVHGRMRRRIEVYDKCYAWMKKADAMFAYIDGDGAYGTCLEIDWFLSNKHGRAKCFVVFSDQKLLEDYWFLAARVWPAEQDWDFVVYPDVRKAFADFARWVEL
jgi:hypothetical protein